MAMAVLALVGPAGRAQAPPETDDFGRELAAQAARQRGKPRRPPRPENYCRVTFQ